MKRLSTRLCKYQAVTFGTHCDVTDYKSYQDSLNLITLAVFFRGLFSDRMIALGQTVFVTRCDIPQAPMLKLPIKWCHLNEKGDFRFYAQTDPLAHLTPSGGEILAPHSAAVFSSSLLPCPSMSLPHPPSPSPSPPWGGQCLVVR